MILSPGSRSDRLSKRAVCIAVDTVTVYHWDRRRGLTEPFAFDANETGLTHFSRYLRESPALPTSILVDIISGHCRRRIPARNYPPSPWIRSAGGDQTQTGPLISGDAVLLYLAARPRGRGAARSAPVIYRPCQSRPGNALGPLMFTKQDPRCRYLFSRYSQ